MILRLLLGAGIGGGVSWYLGKRDQQSLLHSIILQKFQVEADLVSEIDQVHDVDKSIISKAAAAAESAGFGALGPHITLDMIQSLRDESFALKKVKSKSECGLFY
jgi:hypothetical protein